jgi:hypothetical protein
MVCRNPMEESRQIGGPLGAVKVARPAVGGGKLGDYFKELPITIPLRNNHGQL